jgi:tRNA/tmRNA/rRNA uracil-C5-methylase (TrmA/RlmC/RlmD family)
MLPDNARVLDVGCGYGRIALPLVRAGYEVEGIDLSENLVEAALRAAEIENLRIHFAVGSMTSLPYRWSRSMPSSVCGLPSTSCWMRASRRERSGRCGRC